jgi:hypothetical protein
VKDINSKEYFILKVIPLAAKDNSFDADEDVNQSALRIKEVREKKEKFEELIKSWKAVAAESQNVVRYIKHWYDHMNEYLFVITECSCDHNLSQEIQKRIEDNRKFSENV